MIPPPHPAAATLAIVEQLIYAGIAMPGKSTVSASASNRPTTGSDIREAVPKTGSNVPQSAERLFPYTRWFKYDRD